MPACRHSTCSLHLCNCTVKTDPTVVWRWAYSQIEPFNNFKTCVFGLRQNCFFWSCRLLFSDFLLSFGLFDPKMIDFSRNWDSKPHPREGFEVANAHGLSP